MKNNIGILTLLTNREAAQEGMISLGIENFIPTRVIGQEEQDDVINFTKFLNFNLFETENFVKVHSMEISQNHSHADFFRQTIFVIFLPNLLWKMRLFFTICELSLITQFIKNVDYEPLFNFIQQDFVICTMQYAQNSVKVGQIHTLSTPKIMSGYWI